MNKKICSSLLYEYKQFDYINSPNETLIKIFVGYVKPSFLFKTNILTPIHLGREIWNQASKFGSITIDDLSWLKNYCIGDNEYPDNISNLNRRIGLFTGTYFAWKNYSILGNPKYFGSF